MPTYTLTHEYGPAITVKEGDLIQNVGQRTILVCPKNPPADENAAEIEPGLGLRITTATQIRARSVNSTPTPMRIIEDL